VRSRLPQAREVRCLEPGSSVDLQRRLFRTSGVRALESQPDYLQGAGKLRDYQLDGLNWMVYSWSNDHNCILADEVCARMGGCRV
jgi:chromodomain-helicase-DNA-binding protein 1